jgi:hypothetical protein
VAHKAACDGDQEGDAVIDYARQRVVDEMYDVIVNAIRSGVSATDTRLILLECWQNALDEKKHFDTKTLTEAL